MSKQLIISTWLKAVYIRVFSACLCLQLLCFMGFGQPKAQATGPASEVFNLVNLARSNPKAFLEKHRDDIQVLRPAYLDVLEKAKPLPKLEWDADLLALARDHHHDQMKRDYAGDNDLCRFVSGQTGHPWPPDNALFYLSRFYSYIHDESCTHIGFFMDDDAFVFTLGIPCHTAKPTYTYDGLVDTVGIDFKALDTGAGISWLSKEEKSMIFEINLARQHPAVYAAIIGLHLEKQSNIPNRLSHADLHNGLELMGIMEHSGRVSILQPKRCLQRAAQQHADELRRSGILSHTGADYSKPYQRIQKHCKDLSGSENLVGGHAEKGVRGLIIHLLGSPGHRENMLDPDWQYVACSGYVANKKDFPKTFRYMEFVQKFAYEKPY